MCVYIYIHVYIYTCIYCIYDISHIHTSPGQLVWRHSDTKHVKHPNTIHSIAIEDDRPGEAGL